MLQNNETRYTYNVLASPTSTHAIIPSMPKALTVEAPNTSHLIALRLRTLGHIKGILQLAHILRVGVVGIAGRAVPGLEGGATGEVRVEGDGGVGFWELVAPAGVAGFGAGAVCAGAEVDYVLGVVTSLDLDGGGLGKGGAHGEGREEEGAQLHHVHDGRE
ncbi:hypothetical protein LTR86_001479 [Recurvomyces mirabilis]|nr:hypothetical protein LTR86_001479 [Recurvomyces mirabilis]